MPVFDWAKQPYDWYPHPKDVALDNFLERAAVQSQGLVKKQTELDELIDWAELESQGLVEKQALLSLHKQVPSFNLPTTNFPQSIPSPWDQPSVPPRLKVYAFMVNGKPSVSPYKYITARDLVVYWLMELKAWKTER